MDKLSRTVSILIDTLKQLLRHPLLLIPIMIGWIYYASAIIYFDYHFNWDSYTFNQGMLIIFLILLSFCFVFSLSSFILLEIIEQIETNNKVNLLKALSDAIFIDTYKALPIIFIWAIIYFILGILEAIFSRRDRDDNKTESYENIAGTLSGYDSFSLTSLSFDIVKSGIRLIVFFIFPAIAWEEENFIGAIKKGTSAVKEHFQELLTGFISIEFVALILGIPAGIMLSLSEHKVMTFSDSAWLCLILYIAFASSLYLYLQQMFAASLYLWIIKWKRAVRKAKLAKMPIPELKDITPPSLLDNVPDLKYR